MLSKNWNSLVLLTLNVHSETTAEGRRITRLDRILLNGNNITMVSDL